MKFKFYIFIYLIIIACSSDQSGTDTTCLEKFRNLDTNKNKSQIALRLKIEKDDVLEVYFINDPKELAFQANKKIRKKVRGSTEIQEVHFNLPNQIRPHKFRIDLGENNEQKNIRIDEIKILHNNNIISIKDSLIPYFFVINNYLKLKDSNGNFDIQEKEKKRDPFITSNATLNKKIKIEL